MPYVVITSDGAVHETDSAEEYVALLDEHGPEVVDSCEPPGRFSETNRAMVAQYAKRNPRTVGSIFSA